ncbi:AAA family ATPase [Streptomyces sp. NPDC001668]
MTDTTSLRDLLLARLPGSGLSAEEQALLRDLLPAAQPRNGRRSGAVYLRSITASGWRGIGPAATVRLNPGPGLTLVAGRNGSGKSSFAEAAEMALTGDNFRWQGRTQVWKKGWRNLHEHSAPEVAVELCFDAGSDGEGAKEPVTVRRIWHGEGLEESRTVVE